MKATLPYACVSTLLVWLAVGTGAVSAQHFTGCLTPQDTGTDATVIVRDSVETLFPDGASLEEGDEIALVTSDGTCAGTAVWSSSDENLSLSAAGPNASSSNDGPSGYEPGEFLKVKVWDESRTEEYDLGTALEYASCTENDSLCRDDGAYENGAVYSVVQLGNSETLPVELVNFDVTTSDNWARLEWKTASETNNVGFQVQHRTPGEEWSTLKFVEGAGTTSTPQEYSHTVRDLEPGRHHFRLRQTDSDGTSTISKPLTVELSMDETYELKGVAPNPIRPHGQLTLRVREAQSVTVSMFNTLGQRVRTIHQGRLSANRRHSISVDGSDLPSGRYLIRIRAKTFTATQPVTVLR